MKKINMIIVIILIGLITLSAGAYAQEKSPSPSPTPKADSGVPTPTPPLENVPDSKFIQPQKGVSGTDFSMKLKDIESLLGRGEILPGETDFSGNSWIDLVYPKKMLRFKFFNGELSMIIIENPEFGTKGGTHVGGSIGDGIREYGPDFRQEKSIVQSPDPNTQEYELFYDKKGVAFKCRGKIIQKIRLRTPFKIKSRKKK
ncbi:MAG: hypothetical protein K8T10_03960 [Candidatus Eremiobacteraeota bacterium]|nr:hypothetical protein [Candidatus Eremiobacteraeota bacterium]